MPLSTLRIATWNIHEAIGMDRRYRPDRIAAVLVELDADIVALQEVSPHAQRVDELCARLADAIDAGWLFAPTFDKRGRAFGNALLSRLPIVSHEIVDLSHGRREPRNAIDARLACGGGPLRVVATHLGLAAAERAAQVARLVERTRDRSQCRVVLGDFNEWRAQGSLAAFGQALPRAPATFPSPVPIAALDRIIGWPTQAVSALHAHRSRATRIASDHLPLVATLDLQAQR